MNNNEKFQFLALIYECVDNGIDVTLTKRENKIVEKSGTTAICADLNPETKSGMYLYPNMVVTGRYDEVDTVETFYDLIGIFVSRYQSRGFGNSKWLDIAVRYGMMKKEIIEIVKYTPA